MTANQKWDKIHKLQHACQCAVGFEQSNGSQDGTPKHLRVGINESLVQLGALTALLISKNVFTEDEYLDALTRFYKLELSRYEQANPGIVFEIKSSDI